MYIVKEFQEVTTPKSAKVGDIDHDLSGEDASYKFQTVNDIVTFLRLNNVIPSTSSFNPDLWYTTKEEDEDVETGNKTAYSFFLDNNMSDEEKHEVFMRLSPSRVGRISSRENVKLAFSQREKQHCLVCGKDSTKVGIIGTASKYKCDSCGYQFSNR